MIDFIKNKLKDMINRIEKLVNIQDLLYIESNKKVKVYQDKRNNNLYIEDSDYLKEKNKDIMMDQNFKKSRLLSTHFYIV